MSAVASDELPPFGGLREVLNFVALMVEAHAQLGLLSKVPIGGRGSHSLLHTFEYLWIPCVEAG